MFSDCSSSETASPGGDWVLSLYEMLFTKVNSTPFFVWLFLCKQSKPTGKFVQFDVASGFISFSLSLFFFPKLKYRLHYEPQILLQLVINSVNINQESTMYQALWGKGGKDGLASKFKIMEDQCRAWRRIRDQVVQCPQVFSHTCAMSSSSDKCPVADKID